MQFPTLGPSSLPVVVAQPDERHANRAASLAQTKKKKEEEPSYLMILLNR